MNCAFYPSVRNKNVLITGGAEGIGAATVKLFALQGSRVFFLDIADDSAQRTINDITSSSPDPNEPWRPPIVPPTFIQCDVVNLEQLKEVTNKILEECGMIHILINNAAAAGGAARLSTEQMTPEMWDFNINANLRHIFFLTQAVLPSMIEARGGSIVNLGSITWRIPATDVPVYTACKAAIMGLTRAHSKEFGEYGIRVNSVMPGAIATERQIKEVLTPQYRAEVMRNQSLQRDLTPDEVAKVIVFLASDEASGVTGSSYVVDGGWVSDP